MLNLSGRGAQSRAEYSVRPQYHGKIVSFCWCRKFPLPDLLGTTNHFCRKTGNQLIKFQSVNNPDWQIIFFYVPYTSIRLSLAKISELLKCRATIYGCEKLFSSFPAGRERCFCYGFPQPLPSPIQACPCGQAAHRPDPLPPNQVRS